MNPSDLSLRRRFVIAVATIVIASLLLYVLITKPFADQGVKLFASFGTAGQGIGTTSPVKVRGMEVGRVAKVELQPDGRAKLTLRILDGFKVPDTVEASLEPASVFGPKFVNLIMGEHEATGPYLPAGATIAKTDDPLDLNDLLKSINATLGAIDARDIAIIITTLGEGFGGQGPQMRQLVDDIKKIVDVAHEHRADARKFLHNLAVLAQNRGVGDDISSIVADTDAVIATAANGNGRLDGFARGVTDISSLVGHGFEKHGDNLGDGFRSAENAVSLLTNQLGIVGPAIRTILELLPVYKNVGGFPTGVKGKNMLGIDVLIPINPCDLLLGICRPGAKKLPTQPKGGN